MSEGYKSGPLRKTIHLGKDCGDYIVRLYWADGEVLWVDFDITEILGVESDHVGGNLRECYQRRNAQSSPDQVYTLDEAEQQASGFVKWDGCTQFDVGSVHVDHRESLHKMFDAIAEARRLAADEMGNIIGDEYKTSERIPWLSAAEIAAWVRGDGSDAQRQALADGILEGRHHPTPKERGE